MTEHLRELTEAVNRQLVAGIDRRKGTLESAMHYALSVSGKRLRPLLFLTFLEAKGVDPLAYVDIAAAIEIIHTYSLIHDDMPCMDDDDFRRGFPTVHKKFNEAVALLTGDTLLTLAFEKVGNSSASPEQVVEIVRIITRCIGAEGMAGGQAMDLEFSGDKGQIEEIHRRKTADLIAATLLSAAQIAMLSQDEQKVLAQAARSVGIGFQLADDLLDVEGDEREAGKKLRKDETNSSPNAALHFGTDTVREWIERNFRECMEAMEKLGITHAPFLFLLKKMVYRSH